MRGWRNASRGPSRSSPAAWAGVTAPSSKPRSQPTRQIKPSSPVGSAAATSRSVWVGAGSAATCRRKVPSSLRSTASSSGSGSAPANWSGDSSRLNSTERERVPARVGEEAAAHLIGESALDGRVQERDRLRLRERGEGERREPVEEVALLGGVAHRHQQADAVGVEPAGQEPEGVGALLVEPLRVVDDDQQRASGGGGGEERQRGETDQELVWRNVVAHAEGCLQGASLGRRQRVDLIEERREELVQGREPEAHLGLDGDEAHDVEVRSRRRHRVEQARLADAGFPRTTITPLRPVPGALDEMADLGLFGLAADEQAVAPLGPLTLPILVAP